MTVIAYNSYPSTSQLGFSLLEMAIVMTIIGLLVGGVLTGKSLIRAAELRAFQTEISQYQIAIKTFSNKYGALPGDMANATDFWGAADPNPVTCQATSSTGTIATCNGTGDGHISDFWTPPHNRYEAYRAWQQLANAGLIKGNYSGTWSGGAAHHVGGVNCPEPAANKSLAYSVFYSSINNPGFYNMAGHTFITLGQETAGWEPNDPAFSSQEMYMIDQKMDDGKPYQGKIISVFGTTSDPLTAEYDTTSDTITMPLIYIID